MSLRVPHLTVFRLLPLLLPAALLAAACDRTNVSLNTPTALTDTMVTDASFGVQPATLRPEFLPVTSCVAFRAFGTRIVIVFNGRGDVIVRGLRFRLTDRFGVNSLPRVTGIPGSSPLTAPFSTIPSSAGIPIPGVAPLPVTSAIPIPGASPLNGMLLPAGGSRSLPFFLSFDCGVRSEGTVFVSVDAADGTGRLQTSELRVRLGP